MPRKPYSPRPLIRITRLYGDCLVLMEREIKHLTDLSIASKLQTGPAKDLRDYIKLLAEMKEAHESMREERALKRSANAKRLTDEQLRQALLPQVPPTDKP